MNVILKAVVRTFLNMPKGLAVTLKHLFMKPVTLDYPRKKKPMQPRFMGRHYLERYEDGSERCVCCGLCAAACPADCIYMEPDENERGERYAKVFEVNLLRCIYCGFCEEACPVDAILGSNKHMHTVIAAECIGCQLCIPPCPVDCIDLVNIPEALPRPQKKQRALARVVARKNRLSKIKIEQDSLPNSNSALRVEKQNYIQSALARVNAKRNLK